MSSSFKQELSKIGIINRYWYVSNGLKRNYGRICDYERLR